jgi:hypothetical protein
MMRARQMCRPADGGCGFEGKDENDVARGEESKVKTISRRQFLGGSAIGIAAAGYLTRGTADLRADPLGLPIGCQTWPVRETIGKDFDGTLRKLAADGFRAIEMCSPPGYEQFGFGLLAGMKASEMRERIHAAGLICESCHYGFAELKDHLDERLAYAKELGLKQMIVSTFWLPKDATLADWMRAADEANKLGERTRKAGMQLGFHNHDFEFQKLDGQLIYDKLMGEFDPQAVKLQFQVAVVRLGYQEEGSAARPGRGGLEEDVCRGENRWGGELFPRDGPRYHESQPALPARPDRVAQTCPSSLRLFLHGSDIGGGRIPGTL